MNTPPDIPIDRTSTDIGTTSSGVTRFFSPDPALAVVFPTYDNILSIGSLVLLARSYAGHVIVVDDSSKDQTFVAIGAGAEVIPPAEYGGGRASSIRAGCRRAQELGCRAVVLMEGGDRYLTQKIPLLAGPILAGEADLVIGSHTMGRRKGLPPYVYDQTLHPTSSANPGEFRSTDPGSTFRAISARGIDQLLQIPDSDLFEEEMVPAFVKGGLTVTEIPITLLQNSTLQVDDQIPRYRGKKVAVVVPAYNEKLLIGDTIVSVPDFVSRVYVVNDCSVDQTQEVIDHYAALDPSIIPLRHEKNQGVGAAIVTGYKKALEDGMEIVAVMAGDNQMDPDFLPELLDPIVEKRCDYTMGNRLISQAYWKGMSRWRFFGNTVLTLLTKIASGYWQMVDPQNGYTAISKRALELIRLDDIYPRYGYCNDLLVRLNVLGFRVVNVPHPARYGRETSGIRYSTYIVNLSRLLLKDFLWRLKMKYIVVSFHPLVFFYLMGAFLTALGLLGGLSSVFLKFFERQPIFVPALVSLVIFALGTQYLLLAMLFDMMQEKNGSGWY